MGWLRAGAAERVGLARVAGVGRVAGAARVAGVAAAALGIAVLLGVSGCRAGATEPTPSTADKVAASEAEDDPNALPKALDRLQLTTQQEDEVRTLLAELRVKLANAKAQHDSFRNAMVSTARSCSADDSRLHIEAERMVEAGEGARPAVLDAINAFHAILTPKQRALLADPILSGEVGFREDTADGREQGLGKVADALELSFTQKLQLVRRALDRLSVTTETTGKLRADALTALAAFKRDTFDIRQQVIADAPVVKLYARFILDLAQVIVPVLTREQCDTAGELLYDMFQKKTRAPK